MNFSTDRPNVVVFMTDQQRGATVVPGRCRARTPQLDRLAEQGVTFSRAYTVSPHCCPSRASFFTGLYPSEHGVWNNVGAANALARGPRPGTAMWSEALARHGYHLGFAGKWHVSDSSGPSDHGWEEIRVGFRGRAGVTTPEEQHERARQRQLRVLIDRARKAGTPRETGEIIRPGYPRYVHYGVHEDAFGDRDVVSSAVKFIADPARRDQPWVLYVGTLGPHDPYQPPPEFLDLYDPDDVLLPPSFADPMTDKPALYSRIRDRFDQLSEKEHRDALRHYLAFCSYQDALFGRVRDAVAESGQSGHTVFVYLSDHGDYAGEHGLWGKGLPAFESAYHIPLVIGGVPVQQAAGSVIDTPVTIMDVGPTILDLCRARSTAAMSGRSLGPALRGEPLQPRSELIFQTNGNESYGNQRIVVTDRWKLVMNYFDHDELYDLEADPDELHNLLHQERAGRSLGAGPLDTVPDHLRDIVEDLYRRLWRNCLRHRDDLTNGYILTALATHGPGDVATELAHLT